MIIFVEIIVMEKIFENISQYNPWGKEYTNTGYERKLYLDRITKYIDNKLVKVFAGQRRTGKSYIMRQIISYLITRHNVNPKNIFYFNKEYIGLEEIKTSIQLNDLLLYYKTKLNVDGKIYVFIDEIQNISGWEKFVNSYSQDFSNDYEIFITGSNSKLLSGELSSLLAGRYVEFKIYPFSFKEYIDIHKLEQNKKTYLKFLQTGGMPELINFNNDEVTFNYIESLKNTIILKDIVVRYKVKDVQLLESIFKFIMTNIGSLTSISSIVKYYKSVNKTTNYETISSYIGYLCDSFSVFEVERYDIRGKQILSGVKKYYLNDLSFKNYLLGFSPVDIGYNLENQIFKQLLENNYNVFIGNYKNYEIDFIAQKNNKIIYLQVAYLLDSEKTIEREFGNLKKIKDNYPKYVVSVDDVKFDNIEGIQHFRPWELEL